MKHQPAINGQPSNFGPLERARRWAIAVAFGPFAAGVACAACTGNADVGSDNGAAADLGSLESAAQSELRSGRTRGCTLFDPNPAEASLHVSLPSLSNGFIPQESILSGFGCTGSNRSLPIAWTGAPTETESFALTMHDPDAPTGVGFFHWLLFNIPKEVTSLPLGASTEAVPAGAVQGHTDFGTNQYGGPCPPPGRAHRYFVTVYALDIPRLELKAGTDTLQAGPDATGALLRFMSAGHTLARGHAVGLYASSP